MAPNQSVNNSIFRSFLEKEKLTGSNFLDWYRNLRIVLTTEDKLTYVEHPIPATPVPLTLDQQTVNEVHAMLKLHEHGLPKKDVAPVVLAIRVGRIPKNNKNKKPHNGNRGNGTTKLAYAPKAKIPPPPKKEHPAKDT
ncbi:hypothetical protein CTI12_AA263840 [Artemisia annua]|uniref:Zinc finger, CCHC-type n=1 Tax=Artemisia annua TaxID=35608 RepID=A0A2U1NHK8_ARTAN|nr:hypothetical protein CTI12_AA263840 [Artemisia annua]